MPKSAGNEKTIMTDPSCSVNPVSKGAFFHAVPVFYFPSRGRPLIDLPAANRILAGACDL
jgi:hypothetical protein